MSWSKFSDDCDGCKPVMCETVKLPDGSLTTGPQVPDSDPKMQAILRVWNETTTRQERVAYHAVCCLNSRRPTDVRLARAVMDRMRDAVIALVS